MRKKYTICADLLVHGVGEFGDLREGGVQVRQVGVIRRCSLYLMQRSYIYICVCACSCTARFTYQLTEQQKVSRDALHRLYEEERDVLWHSFRICRSVRLEEVRVLFLLDQLTTSKYQKKRKNDMFITFW
jgi:hypothetical protein